MAAVTTQFSKNKENKNSSSINSNSNNEVSRQEIQAALAKAVELRALHAALMQSNSPGNLRFPSVSPASYHASHFSGQDYPVFTPSYEDEPMPGYQQFGLENQELPEGWDEYNLDSGNGGESESNPSDYKKASASTRKGLPSDLVQFEPHICPADDQRSVTGSCANNNTVLRASPGTDFSKSRRNSLGDFRTMSSCNRCRPAVISIESDGATKIGKNSNIIVPLTDLHSSIQSQLKNRGKSFSWLFSRLKKKHKIENSPNRTESEEVSQVYKGFGMLSVETLKKQLIDANDSRDAALMEVCEMKTSFGELKQKLEYLETYCEELKEALSQAVQSKNSQIPEELGNLSRRQKSVNGDGENLMPVSEEVMVEGFLQMASEARLSVKQFCKSLFEHIEENDSNLMDNLNSLLQPYKLSLNSKYSTAVLYHLEAIVNQALYLDFENCVFQKNGSPKYLDPQQDRQAQFSSFVALRNLSWNEVLRKGTKYYSEEFSTFCDQKMSCIITTLNWTRSWPEQLLQAFFVAAKCIWLLHLLAFSFNPPLGILRVEENRSFDPHYMDDIFMDRPRSQGPSHVKIMVMPGFYLQHRVLRCKVLCLYKSVT